MKFSVCSSDMQHQHITKTATNYEVYGIFSDSMFKHKTYQDIKTTIRVKF